MAHVVSTSNRVTGAKGVYNKSAGLAYEGKKDLSEAVMFILYDFRGLWPMCGHYMQGKEDNDV